ARVASVSSWPVFVADEWTASVVAAAVGLWGSRKRYPQIHSRAGGRSGSGGQRMIDDRSAFGIVIGESARARKTARRPSGYSWTRTLALTEWWRGGDGGICKDSRFHLTVLSLPTWRS